MSERQLFAFGERVLLYAVVALVLLGLSAGTWAWGASTVDSFDRILSGLWRTTTAPVADRLLLAEQALAASALREVFLFKAIALAISGIVVVLGVLLVVKGAEANFRLSLAHGERRGALDTSSPGLVTVSLGCLLIAWTLHPHASFEKTTTMGSPESPPDVPTANVASSEAALSPSSGRSEGPGDVPAVEKSSPPTTRPKPEAKPHLATLTIQHASDSPSCEKAKARTKRRVASGYYVKNPDSERSDVKSIELACAKALATTQSKGSPP